MNLRPMLGVTAVVLAIMLMAGAYAWVVLPPDAQVPVHWGADGQVDGWADKTLGLFLLPAITLMAAALLAVIPRIEPRRTNLERSGKAYAATWIGVVLLLGGLQLLTVAVALGADVNVTRIVLIATGVLFIVIGNYLPKVRSNFLLGIRTPWTLTSDRAWTMTHRLGGRLFVGFGIVLILIALVEPGAGALLAILVGGIALIVAAMVAYSYLVWKDDPARRTT